MGDKNPKSKQRNQNQKSSAKAGDQAKAQTKQDSYNKVQPIGAKTKK